MNTDRTQLTPQEARDQLATSRSRSLASARDRRIHAVGTAAFGLLLGFFTAARNAFTGWGEIVLIGVFSIGLIAQVIWVERAARTVPRRAGLWSRTGIGGSLLLALLVVLPWLNLQAQTEPNTWPTVVVAALVVAVPSLVAAAVIDRGRR